MLRAYFRRLLVTGDAPQPGVLAFSVALTLLIFVADAVTDDNIRLHILYIFPLAMISLHCGSRWLVLLGLVLAVVFQGIALTMYPVPAVSVLTEMAVAVASFVLTIALARGLRVNFLATARLAAQDILTGLPNRRSLDDSIAMEVSRQKRYGGIFSLALIDLDNFKQLNDAKGHLGGDAALQVLATVLREQTRQSDTVGRLGGDEFAMLMPSMNAQDCEALCEKLVDDIAKRMSQAGFAVTASIGYASFTQAPESGDHALQRADKALYKAKSKGKCCVVGL